MKNNSTKLIIYFLGNKGLFTGFKCLGNTYDLKIKEIEFSNDLFPRGKGKKLIDFQLIKRGNIIKQDLCFKFHIFKGVNKGYCFLDNEDGITFDICSLDKNFKISYQQNELKEFNYIENDPRVRIILINSPSRLDINNKKQSLFPCVPKELFEYNSFELSIYDFSKNSFSVKALKEEKDELISIVKYLKENENVLRIFYEKFQALINKKEANMKVYENLFENSTITRIVINFSQRKDDLREEFKDNKIYDLMRIYILWYICNDYYFYKEAKKENKENTQEKAYKKSNLPILQVFEYLNNFYEMYQKDSELFNYQKVLLFCSNSIYFMEMDNIQKYANSALKYVKVQNYKKNSLIGLSIKCLNDFINGLNSQSELFFPLLQLDSGLYHHQNRQIYGFDFQHCEKVKEHLRDLIPDVFFIYSKNDLLEDEKGFNYKGFKTVFLNRNVVLNDYDGNLNDEYPKNKKIKHYAMRVSKFFMHEVFGHNKFIFGQKERPGSPNHFYNKNNRFVTIISKLNTDTKYSTEDYFKVNQLKNEGESGNFFEYFFGMHEGELVTDLFYTINDAGKLLDNVKYFTSDNIEILRKYIINKSIIAQKCIKFAEDEKRSLEQDNEIMEKLIKEYEINLNKKLLPSTIPVSTEIKKKKGKTYMFIEAPEIDFIEDMPQDITKVNFHEHEGKKLLHHLKKI